MTADAGEMTSIFYVDDDSDDLNFFQDAVDAINKNVRLFTMGDDMIKAMHNPPPAPSIVFLDLNMPTKSGFEIINEIKASGAFQGLPLIVYSTASDNYTVNKCRQLGACLYIVKPTSMAALKAALQKVLEIDWATFKPTPKNFLYRA